MKRSIFIRPEAKLDMEDARSWYENQRTGLGAHFLLCVEQGLAKLQRDPELYPIVHKNVRRLLVRRFPYGIFYIVDEDSIVVLAVLHSHRDPKECQSRG